MRRNFSGLNSINGVGGHNNNYTKPLSKLIFLLILLISATYVLYTIKVLTSSRNCDNDDDDVFSLHHSEVQSLDVEKLKNQRVGSYFGRNGSVLIQEKEGSLGYGTGLEHIVFGIAASASLWEKRKNYIKIWWRPELEMRGVVWLDNRVESLESEKMMLPEVRISGDTSKFAYKNRKGRRAAIRISRVVSETLRLGMENVRWFVMGDDDTVFVTDNLVRVLNKYDHNQFYYIGSSSESHLQNLRFSYGMAYGGGGFAISYPLAKALEKIQDQCIQNYPELYGSDDRMHACMSELGVPLTKEVGFHQYDVYGSIFGLLAAHPIAPLVSLHHLDVIEPIFPKMTRVEALQQLAIPMKLDSAGLIQQSICYDRENKLTVSVSWGFAVQLFRGILSPREIEMPSRTFFNWDRKSDYRGYSFNTRPVMRNPCQKPFIFYLTRSGIVVSSNQTLSQYKIHHDSHPDCEWEMADPAKIDMVEVYKKLDPHLWDKSPRRNCCRILNSANKKMVIDVHVCSEGEMSYIGNR
ncbi:glycosyltransferase [Lithospermum erythrorhizon]|uniref:Glycosyltransferase n=1 Tax=Lithospermum erythrorhizon TaxID=34254 RepID=A0AAV3RPH1_LITER